MTTTSVPVLRSARLTLRGLRESDHAALLDLARDTDVARYLHEGPPPSAADIAARVARAQTHWELRGYGMMAVDDDRGFTGRAGVYHPAELADPLLVYAFQRRCWGKGYATEAVGRLLEWLASRHAPLRLLAHIDPLNTASEHVVEKLGAARIGTTLRGDIELNVWAFSV